MYKQVSFQSTYCFSNTCGLPLSISFQGCVVVLEFYLTTMGARAIAPVIAVDP